MSSSVELPPEHRSVLLAPTKKVLKKTTNVSLPTDNGHSIDVTIRTFKKINNLQRICSLINGCGSPSWKGGLEPYRTAQATIVEAVGNKNAYGL